MATPRSAVDHWRRRQRLLAVLLLRLRATWRRLDPAAVWSQQYAEDGIGATLTRLVTTAQVAAARDADTYIAQAAAELGLTSQTGRGIAIPTAYAGVAGDGRPIRTLLDQAVPAAGRRYNQLRHPQQAGLALISAGERRTAAEDLAAARTRRDTLTQAADPADPVELANADLDLDLAQQHLDDLTGAADELDYDVLARTALGQAERWMLGVAATAVLDASRAAESVGIAARPEIGGYVRMLNPPSCSRCAILAGRFYRWNTGFERHPRCDCTHIPASEAIAGDLTVDPGAYFDSLPSAADLDAAHPELTVTQRRARGLYSAEDIFTTDGAQAIRDGANVGQVVNARRGMKKAQVFGRDVQITTEGTTRRGVAAARMRSQRANAGQTPVRLMPESIYDAARDRDDAIRLLRLHGYIL